MPAHTPTIEELRDRLYAIQPLRDRAWHLMRKAAPGSELGHDRYKAWKALDDEWYATYTAIHAHPDHTYDGL